MKILAYGEVMMRLEVPDNKRIIQTNIFDFSFVGTGVNVLTGLEKFKHETYLLSTLPDNALGDAVRADLRKHNIADKFVSQKGNHLGSYILEKGKNYVPTRVTYLNREDSSFNHDLLTEERIKEALEKMDCVHLCGIALSTGAISNQNVKKIVEMANEQNVKVILDFNYRPSLNEDYEVREDYQYILSMSDIVFGSKRDIVELLGHDDEEDFEELSRKFVERYNITVFAGTEKDGEEYSGYLFMDDTLYRSMNYHTRESIENIGTGDAFAAALINGLLSKSKTPKEIIEDSTVYGAMAHYTVGDKPVANPEDIEKIIAGESRKVIR